uniref:coxsackievirus and adenovirus receptor-like n=1 Tax=Myxine glutinosa TaxID=7769 RepID=UPI00358F6242
MSVFHIPHHFIDNNALLVIKKALCLSDVSLKFSYIVHCFVLDDAWNARLEMNWFRLRKAKDDVLTLLMHSHSQCSSIADVLTLPMHPHSQCITNAIVVEGQVFSEGKMYTDRVSFIGDATQGNSSMKITNLLLSDAAAYDCKVKSARKVDRGLFFLAVYEKLAEPVCSKSGRNSMTFEGTDLMLQCSSKQGCIPITCAWQRIMGPSSKSSGEVPSTSVQDVHKGTLLLHNVSTIMSGTYSCTSSNRFWEGSCTVSLNIISKFNRAGVIAGAVLGSLLALLLLLLLWWCCCCRRQSKHFEDDGANDIREDVPAPGNHSIRSTKTYMSKPSSHINLPTSSSDIPYNV